MSTQPLSTEPPVVLCIMDGWGLRAAPDANAVALAETPGVDAMTAHWPHARLAASGPDVGLPEGQVGNSEVGHMNIGCLLYTSDAADE